MFFLEKKYCYSKNKCYVCNMKNTHGGKRKGAGRKKKSNVAHTVRCHPNVIEAVRKYAVIETNKIIKPWT